MVAVVLVAVAQADQCAWIDPAVAESALPYLKPGTVWAELCEPCGESLPVVHKVGHALARPASDPAFSEVSIDGRAVDLAYTYVAVPGQSGLANLAILARCPATGVTRRIPLPGDGATAPDRVTPWLGTWRHGGAELAFARLPDDNVSVGARLSFPVARGGREPALDLTAVIDLQADPPILGTPFPGCRFRVARQGDAIELTPDPGCGPVASAFAGTWTRP